MFVYWNKDKDGHAKNTPYTAEACRVNNQDDSINCQIRDDGFVNCYKIAFAVCNAETGEAEGIFLISNNGYGCYIAIDGKTYSVDDDIVGERYSDMNIGKLEDLSTAAHKHVWSEWQKDDYTHRAMCTACSEEKVETHKKKWFTDIEATADQPGQMHAECTVCGQALDYYTIPPKGETPPSENNFFDVQFMKGQIFSCWHDVYPTGETFLYGNPYDTSSDSRIFSDQDMEDIYFQFVDGFEENPNFPIKMYVYWNKDKGNYKRYTPYTEDGVRYNNADNPANAGSKIDADGFVGRFQILFVISDTDNKVTGIVLQSENYNTCYVAVDGNQYLGDETIRGQEEYNKTIDDLKTLHLPVHMHMWSEEWSGDESNHWHKCIGKNCDGTVSDKGAHTESEWIIDREADLDADREKHTECTVCGRIMRTGQHTHRWSETWSGDGNYHWYTCVEEGCDGTVGSKGVHIVSGWITDRKATSSREGAKHKECTVCKRVLQTAVIPKTKQYSSDKGASSVQDPAKTPEEDSVSNTPGSSQSSGPASRSPKTGDDTPLVCLLVVMMASAGILFVNRKRIHY